MVAQRDIDIIAGSPVDWEVFRDKTIMVTGATGRLGMYIVEALAWADREKNLGLTIVALARNEKKLQQIFGEHLKLSCMRILVQDITEPISFDGDIHYIFHASGAASPKDITKAPVDTMWGHVQGARNVLELAREKKTEKIMYISTVDTYGEWKSGESMKETDVGVSKFDNVRACYSESKRLCETMFVCYEAQYGISYQTVRLCHTFGPGIVLDDGRAFAEFIGNVLAGEDIVLQSDGSAMRTYTYVADAVGAVLLAFSKGREKCYNIANIDNLISVRDMAQMIADLDPEHKVKVRYSQESSDLQYLPFKLGVMNIDRITQLGWTPTVGLQDAFRYTMEAFRQSGELSDNQEVE